MRCHECRNAISARLDGEDPGQPAAAIDEHLTRCSTCRAFAQGAGSLHRSLRLAPAEPIPDLTPMILHAIGREPEPHDRSIGLRVVLALIAVLQIAVAVPALVLGDDSGLPIHSAHHIGSFTAALAVGFLFAAWRPERAAGLLPVAAALVALLLGTSIIDVAAGRTGAAGEAGHVTEIVGLAITWLLARAHPVARSREPVALTS